MIFRPWKFQVIAADIRLRISGFPLWTMACVHMYGDYRGLGLGGLVSGKRLQNPQEARRIY